MSDARDATDQTSRYTAVAIVLHWAIATALIGNALLGWWMADAIDSAETQLRAITAFQLHKSLGLTVLALSVVRLAWRLLHRPPTLPASMPRWERYAAAATHWAFYGLLIALPLTGWLFVSAQWRDGAPLNVPTLWFGQIGIPHLLGLNHASAEVREMLSDAAIETHEVLAWGGAGLLVLHVGAALKHHFVQRDSVLLRMLPRWSAGEWSRATVLVSGLVLTGIGASAIAVAFWRVPLGSLAFTVLDNPVVAPSADTAAGRAGNWSFDPEHGSVLFNGSHAGAAFKGEFTRWKARLEFEPDDLAASTLNAEIETASATDGMPLHDQTLPEREWFDVVNSPTANFRSTRITAVGEGRYAVEGILRIKGRDLGVALELRFDVQGVAVTGRFVIDRVAADLGMESDPDAEFVSREIGVTVRAAGIPAR